MPPTTPQRSPERRSRFLRLVGWLGAGIALCTSALVCLVIASWLVGDGSLWWQRLSWIPAVALLPPLLVGLLSCLVTPGRFGLVLRWTAGLQLLFTASWVAGVDYGVLRARAARPGDWALVHWNATSNWGRSRAGGVLEDMLELGPELIVVTNPGQRRWSEQDLRDRTGWDHVARNFAVLVVSRHPIRRCQVVLAAGGAKVARVVIDRPLGEFDLWAVDFPSDPGKLRSSVFGRFASRAGGLDLPEPDLVVGDFNVPRNSVALKRCFPDMRNAFDLVGVGWHGTWPAGLPLWQLDQVLLGPDCEGVRYEVFPTPVGTHRLQKAVVRPRSIPRRARRGRSSRTLVSVVSFRPRCRSRPRPRRRPGSRPDRRSRTAGSWG